MSKVLSTSLDRRKAVGKLKQNLRGYAVMTPGIILFSFFVWIPLVYAVVM